MDIKKNKIEVFDYNNEIVEGADIKIRSVLSEDLLVGGKSSVIDKVEITVSSPGFEKQNRIIEKKDFTIPQIFVLGKKGMYPFFF